MREYGRLWRQRGTWNLLVWIVVVLGGGLSCREGQGQTFSTLYSFTGGSDGAIPRAGVIQDTQGNLYGVTSYGGIANGSSGYGVVFKIDPQGIETILHTFTTLLDGSSPFGGLLRDAQGNLYGTTEFGGANGRGTVFKLDSQGNKTILYSFMGESDGSDPRGSLIQDAQGNLYGTTLYGGIASDLGGFGVVYKLDPSGTETVLHAFTDGADGALPATGVILDAQGNLYGTADYNYGSQNTLDSGVVFQLDTQGNLTILHSFTGPDGGSPRGILRDAQGNIYGTTAYSGPYGGGVVFKLDPQGNLTILHAFTGGSDGAFPYGGVIQDAQGNLYGTTAGGGNTSLNNGYGYGVVYKLDSQGNETVLHTFNGSDGESSYARLLQDAQGNLYGTTQFGGAYGWGVVFEFSPTSMATITTLTFNPSPVTGGNSTVGTVALNGPAPPGGLLVNLSSGNPAVVQVPASVTVPAGQSTVTFKASSTPVKANTLSIITASAAGISAVAVLPVNVAVPINLSCSANPVIGGNPDYGTVTTSGPAPSGGLSVSLSTNNPAITEIPAYVTIIAGQTSGTFYFYTYPVNIDTSATLSATVNGVTTHVTLKIQRNVLQSLRVKPDTIKGGKSATGTVLLTQPAPTGGVVVSLSSSAPTASVPISVTVPAGQSSATFEITTSKVTQKTVVTLSAAYGGATKTATLTIKP